MTNGLTLSVLLTGSILAQAASSLSTNGLERLEPPEGCYIGVHLGSGDSIESFSYRVGLKPAVCCRFIDFPLTTESRRQLTELLNEVRPTGGIALVTLEPNGGLVSVTDETCLEFAQFCAAQETQGVHGILVRFGHEMNGNWYAWGQHPVLYKDKFRLLAEQIHSKTIRTAMMWAPNYGGGYPFTTHRVDATTPDLSALDTDSDGVLTENDDPYEPYYPGDDAVDWVGLTVYHWGTQWPWLENELPEPNSFAQYLTGEYVGRNGDQTAVPDFYARYCAGAPHAKPLAIPETAAFFNPHQGGVPERAIKQAWLHQLFNISGDTPDAVDVARHFPRLKCINWFDHYKFESETGQWIDWRVSGYQPVRAAFLRAIRMPRGERPWFLTAPDIGGLQQDYAIADLGISSILPLNGAFTLTLFVKAQADCDLAITLVEGDSGQRRALRVPVKAGGRIGTFTVPVNRSLTDGATYRWSAYLAATGGERKDALALYEGLPRVARAISPSIQIVAAPPLFIYGSNATVRVRYSAAESAVAVVNLLDGEYNWHGGGAVQVGRGDGLLDIPFGFGVNARSGRYTLESFLSDTSTNWQRPMARSENATVELIPASPRDSVRTIVEPEIIRSGEVFRFVVEYGASTNRDLHIDLFDARTNFLAGTSQPVPPGSGIRDMTLSAPTVPPGDYFVTAFMTPSGQSWEQTIAWSPDQLIQVVSHEYDDWLQAHWGVILATDNVGPDDDPDGDGVSNLGEFEAGTDPRDRSDVFKASVARSEAGWVIAWASVVGRRYQLFQTVDVGRGLWIPAGDSIAGTGSVMQLALGAAGGGRFFRVQALPATTQLPAP